MIRALVVVLASIMAVNSSDNLSAEVGEIIPCNPLQNPCAPNRVRVCHYNGTQFNTMCIQQDNENWNKKNYCGACNTANARAFTSKAELQAAVNQYQATGDEDDKNFAPISSWDVSQVTDFSELFSQWADFNEDIGQWDVSQATDMSFMFWGAKIFNKDLSMWNVSNVSTFERMFFESERFNSDLSSWTVGKSTNMMGMFWRAGSFNQPIGSWDSAKMIVSSRMFCDALEFNADVSQWDVSQLRDSSFMFMNAKSFDQDLRDWNVAHLVDFHRMFYKSAVSSDNQALVQRWQKRLEAEASTKESVYHSQQATLGLKIHDLSAVLDHLRQMAAANATMAGEEPVRKYEVTQTGGALCPSGVCKA